MEEGKVMPILVKAEEMAGFFLHCSVYGSYSKVRDELGIVPLPTSAPIVLDFNEYLQYLANFYVTIQDGDIALGASVVATVGGVLRPSMVKACLKDTERNIVALRRCFMGDIAVYLGLCACEPQLTPFYNVDWVNCPETGIIEGENYGQKSLELYWGSLPANIKDSIDDKLRRVIFSIRNVNRDKPVKNYQFWNKALHTYAKYSMTLWASYPLRG